jgi:hypothetical protein
MAVTEVAASGASGRTGNQISDGKNWANTRASAAFADTNFYMGAGASGGARSLYRGFMMFNTGALGALSITSAKVKFSVFDNINAYSNHTMYVVPTNPASPTGSLVAGDHTTMTMTDYGNVNKNGWTGAHEIALNAAGVAAVSLTGITKLGITGYYDFVNSDLGGGSDERWGITSVVLEVTYVSSSVKKIAGTTYATTKKVGGVTIATMKKIAGLA